jgi:hypothetical protein
VNRNINENTADSHAECEIMDPKQASTKRSGQALGWLCQKLIPQLVVVPVEVQKAGAQASYRHLKAGRARFGALHIPKVKIQS